MLAEDGAVVGTERIAAPRTRQRGFALTESLIGVLLIAVGILAVLALQGTSIAQTRDAKYRSEASFAAMELLAAISASADRASAVTTTNSVCAYQLNSISSPGCPAVGAIPGALTNWLARVAAMLPDAAAAQHSIDVDATAGNRVTITVQWRSPNELTARRYMLVGAVN